MNCIYAMLFILNSSDKIYGFVEGIWSRNITIVVETMCNEVKISQSTVNS